MAMGKANFTIKYVYNVSTPYSDVYLLIGTLLLCHQNDGARITGLQLGLIPSGKRGCA